MSAEKSTVAFVKLSEVILFFSFSFSPLELRKNLYMHDNDDHGYQIKNK